MALIPETAARQGDWQLTGRGTVVMHGVEVTDSECLDMITLGAGENVVEVSALAMPWLAVSH